MQKFNCPSCGAEIIFQSSISVSCVCPYCRSLLVRHDKDMESIGKMAELPDDISPFQIGTTGKYKNIPFTLVGRMKIGWSDGCWNEWCMFTDDGRRGWLAEAQGSIAISFEVEIPSGELMAIYGVNDTVTTLSTVPPLGTALLIQKKEYTINDIKAARCIGSEGELPFPAPQGRMSNVIDLEGMNGEFASIEFDAFDQPHLFIGEYVEFDMLHFNNLRDLPGWHMNRPPLEPHPQHKKAPDGW